jgi:hypothetical protein
MAGGMTRRSDRLTLHERIHGMPPPADPTPVKRCWVLDEHGRQPGLLLEWRRTAAGWQGRVVRPIRQGQGWAIVEDWIAAEQLEADREAQAGQ